MASTTERLKVNPSGYDSTNYSYESVNSSYPLSKPIGKGSSNSTYAQWSLKKGFGSETYVFYLFDLSAIHEDATIDSVECTAKGYSSCSSNMVNYVRTQTMQMFFGTSTAKGTAAKLTDSVTTATIDGGTWTREELNDCRLRIYGIRSESGTSTTYYHRFYGADLTVTYTYNSEKFMMKTGGAWADAARVFKKVNGIWVEQTELSSVVEDGVRYKNGGEYVSPQKTVTITGNGTTSDGYFGSCVQIGDVQYKSPAVVQVETGTTIKVTTYQLPIYLNGVLVAEPTMFTEYNHVVNSDCTVLLSVDTLSGGDGVVNITT